MIIVTEGMNVTLIACSHEHRPNCYVNLKHAMMFILITVSLAIAINLLLGSLFLAQLTLMTKSSYAWS